MRDTDRSQLRCWKTWEERLRISYGSVRISIPATLTLSEFTADVQQKGNPHILQVERFEVFESWVFSEGRFVGPQHGYAVDIEATYHTVSGDLALSRRRMNGKADFEF
jgi:hypothetical protein